jgi:hypothetical protein
MDRVRKPNISGSADTVNYTTNKRIKTIAIQPVEKLLFPSHKKREQQTNAQRKP